MRKILSALLAVAALSCIPGYAKDAPEAKNVKYRLLIGTELPDTSILKTVSQKLAVSNPETEISISRIKPEEGLSLLEKSSINMLISEIQPEGKDLKKFQVQPFAVSAVKIIVSAENPLSDISPEKAAKIFSREFMNWKDAGGPDAPITIYGLDRNSETSRTFEALIMGKSPIYEKILSVNTDKEISTLAAADKNAIAYAGMTNIKSKRIKSLAIDGAVPSPENVISGKYKYARKLYIITLKQTEQIKKFTDALNGPEGNETVRSYGLLPLSTAKK